MTKNDKKIILASASPRRKELLKTLVDSFTVLPSGTAEVTLEGDLIGTAVTNAKLKAEDVYKKHGGIVIGADTVVELSGIMYGKPADADDARRMLRALSGKKHRVCTGVCVVSEKECSVAHSVSVVTFNALSDALLEEYIATGKPLDKAGAYGIQDDPRLIASYTGYLDNIVGLPVEVLGTLLKTHQDYLSRKWNEGE